MAGKFLPPFFMLSLNGKRSQAKEMNSTCEIIFEPSGRKIRVESGVLVTEAAQTADVWLDSICGGAGTCGKCRVIIRGEATPLTDLEISRLSIEDRHRGIRLACQTRVIGDCVILLQSPQKHKHSILTECSLPRKLAIHPSVQKKTLNLVLPTLDNPIPDLDRVLKALDSKLGCHYFNFSELQNLPNLLRESNFQVSAIQFNSNLIGIERGDTSSKCLGMAFDIGTTTLVGYLFDLLTGKVLAISSGLNDQAIFGDDLISRIQYGVSNPSGKEMLRKKVVDGISQLIQKACESAGEDSSYVYHLVLAGNTCMMQFLLGIETKYLGQSPYIPALRCSLKVPATEFRFPMSPFGVVTTLPNIAGLIGADTIGMMLATRIHKSDKIRLAVDIGTNGEIVLGSKDRLMCCSAAAGPAFEGARITFGMRGTSGAIDSAQLFVDSNGHWDLDLHTIEDARPRGICGSGLLDIVAALLDAGVIDETGRIMDPEDLPEKYKNLAACIKHEPSGNNFILVSAEKSPTGTAIFLAQKDVRELQLAKGAILAGIRILCDRMEIRPEGISEVLLAGAFGNYVRKESALRVGLIPNISPSRIKTVGNAAGTGACMALLSEKYQKEADRLSEKTEYVELGGHSEFQNIFADSLLFPD